MFRDVEVSWSWMEVLYLEFVDMEADVGCTDVCMVAFALRSESLDIPARAIVPLGRCSVTSSDVFIDRERALLVMRASSWCSVRDRDAFSMSLMRVSVEDSVMDVLIA